jgi:hypothetical protein
MEFTIIIIIIIYSVEAPATSRPTSPGAGSLRSPGPCRRFCIQCKQCRCPGGGCCGTQLMVSTPDINTGGSAKSHTHPGNCFDIYYQYVRGLKQNVVTMHWEHTFAT